MIEIKITANESGQRFDKYLAKYLKEAPKSFIYKMLRKKNIVLNGKKSSGDEKLNTGDIVKMFMSDETIAKFKGNKASQITSNPKKTKAIDSKDIIFEDSNILLINKKPGVLSQKAEANDISINEMMITYLLNKNELTTDDMNTFKPSVCNRLDRNTTGLIACGKSLLGLQELSAMFKDRTVDKYYITIVKGCVKDSQEVTGYLSKDEKTNKVYISEFETSDSSFIKTSYLPLYTFEYKNINLTLLKVKLHTGKPHQIRAHLSSVNHPIIGDAKYGDKYVNDIMLNDFKLKYQLLHSYSLTFPVDNTKLANVAGKTFVAELPSIYERIAGGEIYGYLEFKRS